MTPTPAADRAMHSATPRAPLPTRTLLGMHLSNACVCLSGGERWPSLSCALASGHCTHAHGEHPQTMSPPAATCRRHVKCEGTKSTRTNNSDQNQSSLALRQIRSGQRALNDRMLSSSTPAIRPQAGSAQRGGRGNGDRRKKETGAKAQVQSSKRMQCMTGLEKREGAGRFGSQPWIAPRTPTSQRPARQGKAAGEG